MASKGLIGQSTYFVKSSLWLRSDLRQKYPPCEYHRLQILLRFANAFQRVRRFFELDLSQKLYSRSIPHQGLRGARNQLTNPCSVPCKSRRLCRLRCRLQTGPPRDSPFDAVILPQGTRMSPIQFGLHFRLRESNRRVAGGKANNLLFMGHGEHAVPTGRWLVEEVVLAALPVGSRGPVIRPFVEHGLECFL